MTQKWPILTNSLFKYATFRLKLYTDRCRMTRGIFWDNFQVSNMFQSRVIDEKRVEKSSNKFCRPNGLWKAVFTFTSQSDKFNINRCRMTREMFWDNIQLCNWFCSRVISDKRVEKSSTKFCWSNGLWKRPFSVSTRNSTKFADNNIRGCLFVFTKFEMDVTNIFQKKINDKSQTDSLS